MILKLNGKYRGTTWLPVGRIEFHCFYFLLEGGKVKVHKIVYEKKKKVKNSMFQKTRVFILL